MTVEEARAFADNPPAIDGIEDLVYVWNPVLELLEKAFLKWT
jgi:hypothetical protein